jgi:hypothetical protein
MNLSRIFVGQIRPHRKTRATNMFGRRIDYDVSRAGLATTTGHATGRLFYTAMCAK